MIDNIHSSWKEFLSDEFDKPYFPILIDFVKSEYSHFNCYPKDKNIFNAFNHSTFDKTKVVIIGQDPYHGPHQANGLCFSVNDGIRHPPSLVNIFKEIEADIGTEYPISGNLERWAKQGVLLLNATLTVRESDAGSHQHKGWEQFTDAVIKLLSRKRKGVVFLLWGEFAKKKTTLIDSNKHHIFTSGHPSPLSANRGLWFNNKHFSSTNSILLKQGCKCIDW